MNNFKNVIAVIVMVITLALVSCENDKLDTVVEETSTSAIENTQASKLNTVTEGGSMFARRSNNVTVYTTPKKGDKVPDSEIPLSGTYNGSYYYYGGKVLEATLDEFTSNKVKITITKQGGGSFNESGVAYIKVGSVCGEVLAAKPYSAGVREITITATYNFPNTYGIAHLYPTITSGGTRRYYAEPVMLYTNPMYSTNYTFRNVLGTVNGVAVICNHNNDNLYTGDNFRYYKYQCTEFCNRYYQKVYNLYWSGYGTAKNWYTDSRITGVDRFSNGTRPRPGDILCLGGGDSNLGHVAIIVEVGYNYIKIAQQNGGRGSGDRWNNPIGGRLDFNSSTNIITPPRTYTVQGILRKSI